jgi:pyruvate kinase
VVNLCQAAQLPVIIGSNILETLTDAGQPTRAEVTDAAWAQQAECVMLNHGKHMVETVEAVGALLSAMDGVQRKNQSLLPSLHEWKR